MKYLFLQYRHMRWDFPRGHVESGESDIDAARREIREETGLIVMNFLEGFQKHVSWEYRGIGDAVHYKEVTYFLAESGSIQIAISHESVSAEWLTFEEARVLPMHPHVPKVLEAARQFLESRLLKN